MSFSFEGLNNEQKEVVTSTEGPLLVLAGAGSGKTKALTHRIAYLIAEKKVKPENILSITFTNKAAGEMKGRVEKLISASNNKVDGFPMMGTFHSVCARILRREAQLLGYSSSFVIYDEDDAKKVIKKTIAKLGLSDKKLPVQTAKALISRAKNELITPGEYEDFAESFREKSVINVYKAYQKELEKSDAMDFDDLLMLTVKIFEKYPETLKHYQEKWRYILIDEYQDTNHAQYMFAKLLSGERRNLCVVGDDWQCFPGNTLVRTDEGLKKIKDITKNDKVLSASGYGDTNLFKVTKNNKFSYKGQLIKIETYSGKSILCTPNHILFSRIDITNGHYVYLMYSKQKGYRIGTAKSLRYNGRKFDIGLRIRSNQERADKMWILKICKDKEEATYFENLYAYQYGIPMLVFHSLHNRAMKLSQKHIDNIYDSVNTEKRAEHLMKDLMISFDHPHIWPQATTRKGVERVNINVVLFGDYRKTKKSPWSASRLSFNTNKAAAQAISNHLNCSIRSGKHNDYRGEIHNLDFGKIESFIERYKDNAPNNNVNIFKYSFLTDNKFLFLPASQIHPGMTLAVLKGKKIVEEKVKSANYIKYSGNVYDLDVEKVHNYLPSDIVVHNSIYSWRGANFQNILDFEKDYKNAKVIRLEKNYRSTKAILSAAQSVIEKNTARSDKKLWTENSGGNLIEVYEASSEEDEASFIVKKSDELQKKGYKLSDLAVFYRTNAQSRAIEEQLLNARVPYKIVGGVRFYERKEIKDALAWLRVASGANDWVAFERSLLSPPSGIGKITITRLREYAESNNLKIRDLRADGNLAGEVGNRVIEPLSEYFRKVSKIKSKSEKSLSEGVEYAIKTSGLIKHLSDGTFENEERIENLKELLSVVKELETVKEGLTLESFLEEVALISDIDSYSEEDEGITLMTLHTSKGLEYKAVIIVGLEENIFPHSRSMLDMSELEEERRLFYVGMTRAKEELFLTYARKRLYFGGLQYNQPSRFIAEIPPNLLSFEGTEKGREEKKEIQVSSDFKPGDEVEHEFFGRGTILEVVDDEITADFNIYGKKTVSIHYAPIRKV